MNEALDQDENGNNDEASDLYMSSIDLFLQLKKAQYTPRMKSLEPHIKRALGR
jgi:hypothetical protein